MQKVNLLTNADSATNLLENARGVVESYFYRLRDEVLTSDELFEMRIALQDATDTIALACRHIEQYQREVEATEAQA